MALPQSGEGLDNEPMQRDAHLAEIEVARQRQLDALPPSPTDEIAAAHRATIERILEQVRVARRRVSEGLYGVCAGCGGEISVERLELRPWSVTCVRCASRDRH